jgi:hypothetical protein
VDASLQANLSRTALPRFFDPALDLGKIEVIGPAAQVLTELTL